MKFWRNTTISLFSAYFLLKLLQDYSFIETTIALSGIAIILNWLLPAFHIVLLGTSAAKRRLSPIEIGVLTLFAACTAVPLLLLVEYMLLRTLSPFLPLVNSAALTLLVLITPAANYVPRRPPRLSIRSVATSPLAWALLLQVALSITLATAYLALPDIDPYKWANWYDQWLISPPTTTLPTRPLFYFFTYLFTPASHLPLYFFFKYFFPLLSCLPILTAYLTVPRAAARLTQFTWLLLPLFSPGLILYTALPIPQSLLIMCVWFFFHFILYSYVTRDSLFYWLAGGGMFIAFFYHQTAALILCAWLIATLLGKHQLIRHNLQHYKTITVVSGLVLAYITYQNGMYDFLLHWLTKITALLIFKPNWYFPAYYLSIDGQSVGWPGPTGISKYYAFYVGPLLPGAFVLALGLLHRTAVRSFFRRLLTPTAPLFVLTLCAALFFTISEILPRLASIALLPERSWLFGGIFMTSIVWPLLLVPATRRFIEVSLLCLIMLSAGGAFYVNQLKAHTIPDYQVQAAEWIKQNLPLDRIMISSDQPYVLTTNAESRILAIDAVSLCNLDLTSDEYLQDIWYAFKAEPEKERNHITEVYMSRIRDLIAADRTITFADLEATSEHFLTLLNKNARAHDDITDFKNRAYIYFTRPDARNILLDRPYVQANAEATCIDPLFDQHPQFFEKVYDDAGRVMIWRFAT